MHGDYLFGDNGEGWGETPKEDVVVKCSRATI